VLRYLASHGVDSDADDAKGRTALHYAALGMCVFDVCVLCGTVYCVCVLCGTVYCVCVYSVWLCTVCDCVLCVTVYCVWLCTVCDCVLRVTVYCVWLYICSLLMWSLDYTNDAKGHALALQYAAVGKCALWVHSVSVCLFCWFLTLTMYLCM